jgi:hypothetical protein
MSWSACSANADAVNASSATTLSSKIKIFFIQSSFFDLFVYLLLIYAENPIPENRDEGH